MSPVEVCLETLYFGDREWFTDDLELYLTHGYVVSTPEFFALLRPVCSWWTREQLADQTLVASREEADSWYIWQLTGNLQKAVTSIPFRLTYVIACRNGRNRTYRLDALERLTGILQNGLHSSIGDRGRDRASGGSGGGGRFDGIRGVSEARCSKGSNGSSPGKGV